MNPMCLSCINQKCAGTNCEVYTGCIYKQELSKDHKLHYLAASLRHLETLEGITRAKEAIAEADPLNADKEQAADTAYNNEWSYFMQTAGLLSDLLNIDDMTAKAMITNKRHEVMQILGRWEGNK